MRLYHGTSSKAAESILTNGLKSDVDNPVHSFEDQAYYTLGGVYLTNDKFKARTHAKSAASTHGGDPVIIEIEANPDLLVADEDYFVDSLVMCLRFDDESIDVDRTLKCIVDRINRDEGIIMTPDAIETLRELIGYLEYEYSPHELDGIYDDVRGNIWSNGDVVDFVDEITRNVRIDPKSSFSARYEGDIGYDDRKPIYITRISNVRTGEIIYPDERGARS